MPCGFFVDGEIVDARPDKTDQTKRYINVDLGGIAVSYLVPVELLNGVKIATGEVYHIEGKLTYRMFGATVQPVFQARRIVPLAPLDALASSQVANAGVKK